MPRRTSTAVFGISLNTGVPGYLPCRLASVVPPRTEATAFADGLTSRATSSS
jgi:hypothetical protein